MIGSSRHRFMENRLCSTSLTALSTKPIILLQEGKLVHIFCPGLCEVFHAVSQNILVCQLTKNGLVKLTVRKVPDWPGLEL